MKASHDSRERREAALRVATLRDRDELAALLIQARLTDDGLEVQLVRETFTVATLQGRIVGAAGVERHEPFGLLRSVVVTPELRGTGLGGRLVDERLAWSKAHGLIALYLLTETAADFFAQRGFRTVERDSVPAQIQRTKEFAHLCPESAAVMCLDLVEA